MLKEKLEQRKCFPTAWGKLIPEEEAYRQLNRQIAAMTANLFQVMRIFEPSWEKRTEAICDIANMMNMAVAGTPEEQKDYVNASLYSTLVKSLIILATLDISVCITSYLGSLS